MLNLMLTGKMHYIILYNEKINCAKYGTLQSDTASWTSNTQKHIVIDALVWRRTEHKMANYIFAFGETIIEDIFC